jgi:hypothetical protein
VSKEDDKTFTKEEVAKMMKEALAEGIALASSLKAAQAPAPMQAAPVVNSRRCATCGQKNMACKGEHRMAVVYPTDPRVQRIFSGVKINSVRYASNGPGHQIVVPKDCTVEYLVAENERKEQQAMDGRKINPRTHQVVGGSNNRDVK